jgi:hypothetical protein
VITPSPPTFSIPSSTISPIAASLCDEIAPTFAFSVRFATGRDIWVVGAGFGGVL